MRLSELLGVVKVDSDPKTTEDDLVLVVSRGDFYQWLKREILSCSEEDEWLQEQLVCGTYKGYEIAKKAKRRKFLQLRSESLGQLLHLVSD